MIYKYHVNIRRNQQHEPFTSAILYS